MLQVSTAEGKVDVLLEREAVGVSPGPLAASFAVLADDVVVADPTHEEECLAQETFTVVLAADDTLCTVHKPGGHRPCRGMEIQTSATCRFEIFISCLVYVQSFTHFSVFQDA